MSTGRLEAFSDGVLAIILTIMVLEMHAPHEHTWEALRPMVPVFLSYVLSFIYVGIYWNNHHHLFQAAERVTGGTLWANLHLLFWLSLIPLVTRWVGDTGFSAVPVAAYGVILFMSAVAFTFLTRGLIRHHDKESSLVRALAGDWKGKISLLLYAVGIGLTFVEAHLGAAMYAIVAGIWFIPDRRIEQRVEGGGSGVRNESVER